MSDLTKQILFFFILLAVFIGCVYVVPTMEGKLMMGVVAAFTIYGVVRKLIELWRDR